MLPVLQDGLQEPAGDLGVDREQEVGDGGTRLQQVDHQVVLHPVAAVDLQDLIKSSSNLVIIRRVTHLQLRELSHVQYEVISVFSVERVKLDLQELEPPQLVYLLVGQQRVSGQQTEGLQLPAVLREELDGLDVLPAVRDREADQVLASHYQSSLCQSDRWQRLTWFPLKNLSRLFCPGLGHLWIRSKYLQFFSL